MNELKPLNISNLTDQQLALLLAIHEKLPRQEYEARFDGSLEMLTHQTTGELWEREADNYRKYRFGLLKGCGMFAMDAHSATYKDCFNASKTPLSKARALVELFYGSEITEGMVR